MRVTFLIRKRQLPGTALENAANYDAAYLQSRGVTAQVIAVPEGDMVMPDQLAGETVVVEGAGWVPVGMLEKLIRRDCSVIVRVHAAPEFLYSELPGTTITPYLNAAQLVGARLGFVSKKLARWMDGEYIPIRYPVADWTGRSNGPTRTDGDIHLGAFGAVRPLKNHFGQMVAAAKTKGVWWPERRFYFHINATRIEGGPGIVEELEAFGRRVGIALIRHSWEDPDVFKDKVIPLCNVGMFASFAESFCLTAADFVSANVPCVLSRHIPWSVAGCPTDTGGIANALWSAIERPMTVREVQYRGLFSYAAEAENTWRNALEKVGVCQ